MLFSVVSYIVGPDMTDESAYFWSVSGVVKVCHFFLTAILSWGILYIMTSRASLHRSSRLCHLRCCSMSLTLDVFRCLLVTYLAALRWTISILLMSDLRWGSHTEQAYSSDGLTNYLYTCSLTEVEPMFRLRRKKPRVLLALQQMLLMWFSHLSSSLMVTLRYFALSTDSQTWPWSNNWISLMFYSVKWWACYIYLGGKPSSIIVPTVLVYQDIFAGLGHYCFI
jgi:hypothetical protein